MQIICVSKGTHGGGQELATSLSEKMGYACLSRDQLHEAATAEGIQAGKLEMAMVRGRGFSQRLALERDHYLAFSRAYISERALDGSIVYHGRTGHLLLPGVRNIFRIRVVQDLDYRVRHVMEEMNLERPKALRYIQEHGGSGTARLTNREYQRLCPDVSAETIRRDLSDLVHKGILLRIGRKRATYYILKDASPAST